MDLKEMKDLNVSGLVTLTEWLTLPTLEDSNQNKEPIFQMTLGESMKKKSPTMIYSLEDFHARLSAMQVKGEVLRIHVEHCSLKLQELLKRKPPHFYSLKMLGASSAMTREEPLQQSSYAWMNWGMMQNGKCLTVDIGFPNRGTESSLLDILEKDPLKKYFLSWKQVKAVLTWMKKHLIYPHLLLVTQQTVMVLEDPTSYLEKMLQREEAP